MVIYSQTFPVYINGPDCGSITPIASGSLSPAEITYGNGSTDEQVVPTFTDTAGYLAAGLCELGFELVFTNGQQEQFLTLIDGESKILLSQPNVQITAGNQMGNLLVYPHDQVGVTSKLLKELPFDIILNAPDCNQV